MELLNPFSYQDFADDKLVVLDIRARDSTGRWLNIEMQVTVVAGLLQRLVYYASEMYVNQWEPGREYSALQPAISICLLKKVLFRENRTPHHYFRMVDPDQGVEISDSLAVHTVELKKYNLRELLPDVEFQQAISVVEAIAAKTEDRMMSVGHPL